MRKRCKMQNQLLITVLTVVLFSPCFPSFAEESVLQLMEKEFQTIVKSVQPCVVKVTATCRVNVSNVQKSRGSMLVHSRELIEHHEKIGSGILIDDAGHIATTVAVVDDATEIKVTFADGQDRQAKLLGIDTPTDIAVLHVEGDVPLKTKIGNSDRIDTGSWVATVGISYGQSPTLSFGIVGGREILKDRPYYEAIQINTAVSPGNSGGAVVNTAGEIVGLIAATLESPSFGRVFPNPFQGMPEGHWFANPPPPNNGVLPLPNNGIMLKREIGFAIPVNTVQDVAKQIIRDGRVRRGWLGVNMDGVRVEKVLENSPAHKAGILREDVIVAFNDVPIHTFLELKKLIATSAPDTRVTISILRDGQQLQQDVVLAEME